MSETTKQITLKGLFWNAIDRFGYQLVITVVTIITSRILSPEDFGIIGVLVIFSTIATAFVDSGLATSLVRSPEVEEKDYSTMFTFNLSMSLALYLVLFLVSPFLEAYNDIDGLALYARVLFLQLLVHSFGIVQYVKLLRSFSFKITARINVQSIFFSGLISIVLAVGGFGVWALLLQPVLYSLFRTVMLWLWSDWKLDFSFSREALRRHLKFSLSFIVGSILGKIFPEMYYSFIGKHFSTAHTGFYYQGNKWGQTPNTLISSIVQGTTLSTLAPIQNDYPRFLNACRKSMQTLAFTLFPVSFCAVAIAKPAFIFFLTDTWMPSIPYFQLLCLGAIFASLTDMNVNFLNIKGKSMYTLRLEIAKVAIALVVLWVTYKSGIMSIIYGQLGIRLFFFGVSAFFSGKIYGYTFFKQLVDMLPSLCISFIAFICAYAFLFFGENLHHFVLLLLQSIMFACIYVLGNHLTQNAIWVELLQMAKAKLTKR